jgi:hypothetical protein
MPLIIDPKTGNLKHVSSTYIVCDDLQGRDVTVTIARVENKEAVLDQGRKETKIHLYFVGKEKPLLLNTTNGNTIRLLYGKKAVAKEWVGKRITLHPDVTKMKGVPCECIRIRPTVPSGPVQKQARAQLTDEQKEEARIAALEAQQSAQSEPGAEEPGVQG